MLGAVSAENHPYYVEEVDRRLDDLVSTNATSKDDEGNLDYSNDSVIIRETLRLYGSMYLIALVLFCFLRQRFPRLYNIRGWVPENKCALAKREYGFFSWMWEISRIPDEEILDQCGMDALCFLRALDFGRKLAMVGCMNAFWLIPLYATAKESSETSYLEDLFAIISIANVPSESKRFLGTVVAAYITFGCAMYFIHREYIWYTTFRHRFLSARTPRNYTVYVSGIPAAYRSNHALSNYFQRCAGKDVVLEAHVTLDTPSLDAKVARRLQVVRRMEHSVASLGSSRRMLGLERRRLERQVRVWNDELDVLNREISRSIGSIMSRSDVFRSRFVRMGERRELALHTSDDESHDNQVAAASRFDGTTDEEARGAYPQKDIQCAESVRLDAAGTVADEESERSFMGESTNEQVEVMPYDIDKEVAQAGSENDLALPDLSNGSNSTSRPGQRLRTSVGAAAQLVGTRTVVVSRTIGAGTKVVTQGIGTASNKIAQGSLAASQTIAKHSRVAGETIRVEGAKGLKKAQYVGNNLVTSVGSVIPILLNKDEGEGREGGFVIFKNLYSTQTALQVIHHHKPNVMDVQPAPDPRDIFWRNVGMPERARRTGRLAAIAASTALCLFYTVPITFISSLTEVSSLKEAFPKLGDWLSEHPKAEPFFEQLAPLLLLTINEVFLPGILKYFAQWEGNVSSSMLEASLFVKLGSFMIVQTFFVSAISGGIMAELSNILEDPSSIIDLLANSLPAQSSFFMQIVLASTFLLQALEYLRAYPLGVALLRRYIGPNLTAKERRTRSWWGLLCPLEDPPEFWHAETFAQVNILMFITFFVYSTISPVTSFFLLFCFVISGPCYRYQFIHNFPRAFETGGKLWKHFIHFTLASMIIAQLTLIGLLALKQSVYAGPAMGPLLAVTILFIMFINSEHARVSEHLPTYRCVETDENELEAGFGNSSFCQGEYVQPSLQQPHLEPEYEGEHESDDGA